MTSALECVHYVIYGQQKHSFSISAHSFTMFRQKFLVGLLILCWISITDIRQISAVSSSKDPAPPIQLTVYYECLCPDSIDFITKQLWPTFQKISDIMKVELIPFGFGQETVLPNSTYSYKCQHGSNECQGNLIQTCAINLFNDTSKWLPFIYCMESKWQPYVQGEKCAQELKLDYQIIFNCINTQHGNQWLHEMAIKTKSVVPPLNYIPWLVIDGKSDKSTQHEATENLLGLVCRLYQGEKPKSCVKP